MCGFAFSSPSQLWSIPALNPTRCRVSFIYGAPLFIVGFVFKLNLILIFTQCCVFLLLGPILVVLHRTIPTTWTQQMRCSRCCTRGPWSQTQCERSAISGSKSNWQWWFMQPPDHGHMNQRHSLVHSHCCCCRPVWWGIRLHLRRWQDGGVMEPRGQSNHE